MSDCTVIGAGPNGLAAAITLAQAGRKVHLREARATVGGSCSTEELTEPGYLHDRCSAIHPMGAGSPFFRTLPLERHGLEWINPPVEVAHPLEDGSAAALVRSVEETAASFGQDGPAYRRLFEPLARQWPALAEETLQPMLHFPRHPFLLARFGLEALQSAQFFARRHFKTETARAMMAGFAAHSFLPLDAPLSASFALIFGAVGHAAGWPLPRGGSQKISDALAAHLRELGGTIELGRPLASLEELPESQPALLDLSAWNLAAIPGHRLPDRMRGKLRRVRHGAAVFKIDYALSGPVPWKAEACRRAGTVHVGGTFEEVAASEHAMSRGEIVEKPFILFAQQSLFDPTRAPAGKQTGWAYCHVPLGCAVDMTERIERQIERFAPGFRDCILARHVTTPAGFEAHNANIVSGDISGGASDALSLLARPRLSFNPYRLARNLYLCSSSTPPGGGVHGMCGYHAARAALRD
jgi:phytoene dehydrogenase-like protein